MIQKDKVKALFFDFGGTIDSPALHWMKIYLKVYGEKLGLNLTADNFRDAYVHTEREMERLQLAKVTDGLLETQRYKTHLQFAKLCELGVIEDTAYNRNELAEEAARLVTDFSTAYVLGNKPVLEKLAEHYPLHIVSNYYGNLKKQVEDAGMLHLFGSITDSTLVGLRKPDPAIWQLGFDNAGFKPDEVVVIGDSAKNDILPALSLGCQVVKCCSTLEDTLPNVTCIYHFNELLDILS